MPKGEGYGTFEDTFGSQNDQPPRFWLLRRSGEAGRVISVRSLVVLPVARCVTEVAGKKKPRRPRY